MVDFNPYREWLGVEAATNQPNHYELLGLPPFEADTDRIVHAADQRVNLVRKVRPGQYIDQWQKVLDELAEIRRCLTDVVRKQQYDDQLRRQQGLGGGLSAAIVPANPTQQDSDVQVSPVRNLLPPTAADLAREAAAKANPATVTPSGIPAGAGSSSIPLSASPGITSPGIAAPGMSASLAAGAPQSPLNPAIPAAQTPSYGGNVPFSTGFGPVIPASYGHGAGGPPAAAFPHPPGMGGSPYFQGQPQFAPGQQPQYGQSQFGQTPPQYGQQPGYGQGQQPYGQPQAPYGQGQPAFGAAPTYGATQPQYGAPGQAPWGAGQQPPNALAGSWGGAAPAMYGQPGNMATATTQMAAAPMALPIGRSVPAANPMAPVSPATGFAGTPQFSPQTEAVLAALEAKPAVSSGSLSPSSSVVRRRSSNSTLLASVGGTLIGLVVVFVMFNMMNRDSETNNPDESRNPSPPSTPIPAVAAANTNGQPTDNIPPVKPDNAGPHANGNQPPHEALKPNVNDGPNSPMPNVPANPDDKQPQPPVKGSEPEKPAEAMPEKAMPQQEPEKKPEAMPEKMPEKKPEPIKDPTVPTTPESALADMIKAMADAKAALATRNVINAKNHLSVAMSLAKAPDHQAMAKRLESLTHYVDEFWKGVVDGIKGLDGVDELEVGELRVRVVEFSPGAITIRAGGKNLQYTTDDIPSGLAEVLFERVRDMKDPINKITKGAFHAVDKNRSVDSARRIFQEAQLAGGDVADMLAMLDDKYDVKNPPVARAVPQKRHLPDPSALTEATTKTKAKFGSELRAARTAQQKYDLAKKLLEEAALPTDNEATRLAIFNEARDLAANAHLAQLVVQIVDETEKWFEIDVLATKFDALSKAAVKASPQASRDIAMECLQLTDQAEEAKRLDLADKFVRVAGGAARASKDMDLARRATDRMKDIQKVFKEAAAPKPGEKAAPGKAAPAKPDAAKPGEAKPDAAKPAAAKPAAAAAS